MLLQDMPKHPLIGIYIVFGAMPSDRSVCFSPLLHDWSDTCRKRGASTPARFRPGGIAARADRCCACSSSHRVPPHSGAAFSSTTRS